MGNTADSSNVTYGKPKIGGAIHRAPLNTVLPKNAKENVNEAFAVLGYISDDGLTNSNSMESGNVKAWGGDVVLLYHDGTSDKFKFKLIETLNVEVLKSVYGSKNVTGDLNTGIAVKVNNGRQEYASWVVDMVLKEGIAKRIVIPSAIITEIADIVYKDNEATGYEVTLSAIPDADGNTHYEYIVKGE